MKISTDLLSLGALYADMDEREMVNFAEKFGEGCENSFSDLVDELTHMKDEGVEPIEGMKLVFLCKKKDMDYFKGNYSEHARAMHEIAEWFVGEDDRVFPDIVREFNEVDVTELEYCEYGSIGMLVEP